VDDHVLLGRRGPQDAPDALFDVALELDGEGEEDGVEGGAVEALTYEPRSRDQDSAF